MREVGEVPRNLSNEKILHAYEGGALISGEANGKYYLISNFVVLEELAELVDLGERSSGYTVYEFDSERERRTFMAQSDWANCGVDIRWYGERGILNALVTNVQRSRAPVDAVRRLLRAVHWAMPRDRGWIDTFTRATLIVEIGLADFGNPDLMIVCDGPDGVRCVFVEGKVVMYVASMLPNHEGMRFPGFNSSINGQLSLKFRFARALSGASPESLDVAETERQLGAYKEKLGDPRVLPRRLAKPTIVKDIFRPLRLLGLPERHCEYVALTWDTPARAFVADPVVKQRDGLPMLLADDGQDMWTEVAPRVGWLGYGEVEHVLHLVEDEEYQTAFLTMNKSPIPTSQDYERALANLGQTPAEAVPLMDRLAALFEGCEVVKYIGSYSIKEGGQTIGKLIPRGDGVFVGIRESGRPERWFSGPLEGVTVNGVTFRGVVVPVDSREYATAERLIQGLRSEPR
jgi:hypothetical protein